MKICQKTKNKIKIQHVSVRENTKLNKQITENKQASITLFTDRLRKQQFNVSSSVENLF